MSARTQQERRHAQSERTRQAILDATEALLLESGYEAFSIRRLVERCGYTAPSIYHHFGDKDGLLDSLVEARFERLSRQLQRLPTDDPVEHIRAMSLAFVRFGLKNPTHYQLLYLPRAADHAPPRSAEDARENFEKALLELWEAGRLRAGDWRSAGQAVWVLCHGLIQGRIHRPDHEWSKTLVEDSIDALIRGLVAPEPAKRPRRRAAKEQR